MKNERNCNDGLEIHSPKVAGSTPPPLPISRSYQLFKAWSQVGPAFKTPLCCKLFLCSALWPKEILEKAFLDQQQQFETTCER